MLFILSTRNTKVIFYSYWNAEQNPIVAQSKYYVYAFLMSRRKNLQNCMNFPSYKETASFFCCGVFQPPQQECWWYIVSFGAKNWNPRAVNSNPFIRHSGDNFTSCLLLVLCYDVIWLFYLMKLIVFQNSQNSFLDDVTMFMEGSDISMN